MKNKPFGYMDMSDDISRRANEVYIREAKLQAYEEAQKIHEEELKKEGLYNED